MCKFFSSNLDEFFQVRVAGLIDQAAQGSSCARPDGLTPQEVLAAIRARVTELARPASRRSGGASFVPTLADAGIRSPRSTTLTKKELRGARGAASSATIFPVLTPLGVGPGQPFPFISPLSLSLGVVARDPETGEERFARVKVPEGLPRFQPVGQRGVLLPLEAVIAHFLPWLFPGMEIRRARRLPGHPRRRLRGLGRGGRPARGGAGRAATPPLRRRRAPRGLGESMSRAMLDRLKQGLRRRRTTRSTRSTACSTSPTPTRSPRSTGPS